MGVGDWPWFAVTFVSPLCGAHSGLSLATVIRAARSHSCCTGDGWLWSYYVIGAHQEHRGRMWALCSHHGGTISILAQRRIQPTVPSLISTKGKSDFNMAQHKAKAGSETFFLLPRIWDLLMLDRDWHCIFYAFSLDLYYIFRAMSRPLSRSSPQSCFLGRRWKTAPTSRTQSSGLVPLVLQQNVFCSGIKTFSGHNRAQAHPSSGN